MKYNIRELSNIAGVSTRTLRYYDEIGLLKPSYIKESGVRCYGEKEISLLQQILFYKERGFELKQIQQIIYKEDFDIIHALQEHLLALEAKKRQMDSLITTVRQTLASMKGEEQMSDREKFEAFKKKMVKENEDFYGEEIREKYGDQQVDEANQKILHMSQTEWKKFKDLEEEIKERLKIGVLTGIDVDSEDAKKIVELHKEWLCMTWKHYSKEAHKGIAEMYVMDERFLNYYDKEVSGCAELLKQAIFHLF